MKKTISICTVFLLSILLSVTALASTPRLYDGADLLTDDEESDLMLSLDSVYENYGFDLVIVTTDDTNGSSVMEYADDYYDYNGFGDDGLLLLVDMGGREWWISTSGKAMEYFSDSTLDYIGEEVAYNLGSGYYSYAFQTFVSLCESYISNGGDGYVDEYEEPDYNYNYGYNDDFSYDYGFEDEFHVNSSYNFGMTLIISLIAGFVIALIITSSMRSQLTSVGAQKAASNYAINNSLQIAATRDNFLFRNVSRMPRPKANSSSSSRIGRSGGGGHSSHRSSSGRSHGGRGGRF